MQFDPNDILHSINDLRTVFLTSTCIKQRGIWSQPEQFKKTPVAGLLAGFFIFYARHFPQETVAASIRLGKMSLKKTVFKTCRFWRLACEDPFETHDSHFPHDLGIPLDPLGQLRIKRALDEAADTMERLYKDCNEVEDCIGTFQYVGGIAPWR